VTPRIIFEYMGATAAGIFCLAVAIGAAGWVAALLRELWGSEK
jgi:hypothetical protein